MVYDVKRDWFIYPLLPAMLVAVGGGALILYAIMTYPDVPVPLIVIGSVFVALGALLFWFFHGAVYEITTSNVTARLGPFRCRIAFDDIMQVILTHKFFGHGPAWNFALSQDRIYIKYLRTSGKMAWFGLALSPKDKPGFLHELLEVAPDLKLGGDGTLRRSTA
jgi:hypothetical protein